MNEHTPVPWHIHAKTIYAEYTVDGKNHHHQIAEVREINSKDYSDIGTGNANAEFIVRACNAFDEMYEALNTAERRLAKMAGGMHPPDVAALQVIRAVIAKAEGGK